MPDISGVRDVSFFGQRLGLVLDSSVVWTKLKVNAEKVISDSQQ